MMLAVVQSVVSVLNCAGSTLNLNEVGEMLRGHGCRVERTSEGALYAEFPDGTVQLYATVEQCDLMERNGERIRRIDMQTLAEQTAASLEEVERVEAAAKAGDGAAMLILAQTNRVRQTRTTPLPGEYRDPLNPREQRNGPPPNYDGCPGGPHHRHHQFKQLYFEQHGLPPPPWCDSDDKALTWWAEEKWRNQLGQQWYEEPYFTSIVRALKLQVSRGINGKSTVEAGQDTIDLVTRGMANPNSVIYKALGSMQRYASVSRSSTIETALDLVSIAIRRPLPLPLHPELPPWNSSNEEFLRWWAEQKWRCFPKEAINGKAHLIAAVRALGLQYRADGAGAPHIVVGREAVEAISTGMKNVRSMIHKALKSMRTYAGELKPLSQSIESMLGIVAAATQWK
ncbi:MAG: hypothetical protein LBT03_01660 [Holosporales bacterium]|nr:hypothetical protein [Holosporales bacterium]